MGPHSMKLAIALFCAILLSVAAGQVCLRFDSSCLTGSSPSGSNVYAMFDFLETSDRRAILSRRVTTAVSARIFLNLYADVSASGPGGFITTYSDSLPDYDYGNSFALRTATSKYYIGVHLSGSSDIVTLQVNDDVLRGRASENTIYTAEVIVAGDDMFQTTFLQVVVLLSFLATNYALNWLLTIPLCCSALQLSKTTTNCSILI